MLSNKLETVVNDVQGGQAAILMEFDGIPVEFFAKENQVDIETIGMEFSVVLKEARKATGLLDAGAAEELVVRTDKIAAVLRVVSDDYFVAIALSPDGNLGKARYVLRLLAPEVREELA